MTDIMDLIPDFQASPEFEGLEGQSPMVIQMVLATLSAVMEIERDETDFREWTDVGVVSAVQAIMEEGRDGDSPQSESDLEVVYAILTQFLFFLSTLPETEIQEKTLAELIANDGWHQYQMAVDRNLSMSQRIQRYDRDINDSVELPQWQEYTAEQIKAYTGEWVEAYLKTPSWKKDRATGVTQDTLELAIKELTEKAYDEYRKTPKSWTKGVLLAVLGDYFVRNLDLSTDELATVIPAISHLLGFAADQGQLNRQRAENYQHYLRAIAPQVVERSKDANNFGPAKQAVTQMRAEGVDMNDSAQVQAFMDKANAQGGLDSAHEGGARLPDGTDLTAEEFKHLLNDNRLLFQLAEKYDPDPRGDYLDASHVVKKVRGRQWDENDAVTAHDFSVACGLRLWLLRDRYHLSKDWQIAANLISALSQLADMLYAQQLVTLADCSPVIWADFAKWVREAASAPKHVLELLTATIQMLVDESFITDKMGQRSLSVLQSSGHHAPGGNIISMKDARKKRRKKR